MTATSHVAACAWQAGFTQGTGGAARLGAQQEGCRGKRNDPEPALWPERAGSDGKPRAPAQPRRHVRFAAAAPASCALSIDIY